MEKSYRDRTRRRYDRIAPIYSYMDCMIRDSWREQLFQHVRQGDRVLEVGVGTGGNFPFYPKGVQMTAIDFSENMLARARVKKKQTGKNLSLQHMDVQEMNFPDQTFDVVITSCVFCSVPDPVAGLKEIRRVCKPSGKVYLLEHMRSENRFLGVVMDFVNPLTVRISGANINRRTRENIEKAGFVIVKENYLLGTIVRQFELDPSNDE
ncbi:class I SAM-dependent methyltransferase [Texcoconibacillus texcoconensis]|nr:class I SAM-dependent methyltransferase [Texcoconibacillus texcoconensis]